MVGDCFPLSQFGHFPPVFLCPLLPFPHLPWLSFATVKEDPLNAMRMQCNYLAFKIIYAAR